MLKFDILQIILRLLALFLLLLAFRLGFFVKIRKILVVLRRHDTGEIIAAHLLIDGISKLLLQCSLFCVGGIHRAAHVVTVTPSIFVLVSKHREVSLIDLLLVDVLRPTDERLVGLHEGHKGGVGPNQGGSDDQEETENVE